MSGQLAFGLSYRPAMGAEDFIVAPCNADAVRWLDRWPDWPGPALAIHGPLGAGKTHLARVWQERAGAVEIAAGLLGRDAVRDAVGGAMAVVVDGISGDTAFCEVAFLHLYNVLQERGGHLLVADRFPPARWPLRLADLRSRVAAAPAVAILPPDDALLGAVLQKLFRDRQVDAGSDVLSFLLRRMERSFASAHRVAAALDRQALAERRRLTVPLARQVLQQLADDA